MSRPMTIAKARHALIPRLYRAGSTGLALIPWQKRLRSLTAKDRNRSLCRPALQAKATRAPRTTSTMLSDNPPDAHRLPAREVEPEPGVAGLGAEGPNRPAHIWHTNHRLTGRTRFREECYGQRCLIIDRQICVTVGRQGCLNMAQGEAESRPRRSRCPFVGCPPPC